MQNEIRQSIVEATIVKYRHFGEQTHAVKTYIDKKNESIDIRKILEDKKEEEQMKKELN